MPFAWPPASSVTGSAQGVCQGAGNRNKWRQTPLLLYMKADFWWNYFKGCSPGIPYPDISAHFPHLQSALMSFQLQIFPIKSQQQFFMPCVVYSVTSTSYLYENSSRNKRGVSALLLPPALKSYSIILVFTVQCLSWAKHTLCRSCLINKIKLCSKVTHMAGIILYAALHALSLLLFTDFFSHLFTKEIDADVALFVNKSPFSMLASTIKKK